MQVKFQKHIFKGGNGTKQMLIVSFKVMNHDNEEETKPNQNSICLTFQRYLLNCDWKHYIIYIDIHIQHVYIYIYVFMQLRPSSFPVELFDNDNIKSS